jgi:hypothetical protein
MAQPGENGRKLTNKQEVAALLLAEGESIKDAAAQAGCSERAVQLWQRDRADFRSRVQQLRDELFGEAVGRLSAAAGQAVDTLVDLLGSCTPGVRLQAARSILESASNLRQLVDFAGRLQRLEALAAHRAAQGAHANGRALPQ